jgi:hypothetical protein
MTGDCWTIVHRTDREVIYSSSASRCSCTLDCGEALLLGRDPLP